MLNQPMDRPQLSAVVATCRPARISPAMGSRRRRDRRQAAALLSLFCLIVPAACTSTGSGGSRAGNAAQSANLSQEQLSSQPSVSMPDVPTAASRTSASPSLSVSDTPTAPSTFTPAPGYSNVVDRKGRLLMTRQSVAVIKLEPSRVGDVATAARSISDIMRPIDPTLTTAAVGQQIKNATSTSFTLVALRAEPEATQVAALTSLPGVTSSLQERLITTDRTLDSPIFPQLARFLTSHRTSASTDVVHTTIDLDVQVSAQAAVNSTAKPAALVVIQPSTGAILAVTQNSSANRLGPIALNGLYPPGSTFKSITVAQALASGQANADTQLPCPGSTTISDRSIPNDGGFDLGTVSLTTAFAHSCNTTMAGLGAAMPPTAMHTMAARFGLGTDFDIAGITTVTAQCRSLRRRLNLLRRPSGSGKWLHRRSAWR